MVFVIAMDGMRLMPCSERKARILLQAEKASVYQKVPFTIKLNYNTGHTTQPISLGIDTGSGHIGVAVTTGNRVIHKADIELRQDIKQLLLSRRQLRSNRRYRKTRYRRPKFHYHTKYVYTGNMDKRMHKIGSVTRHDFLKLPISTESSRPEGWLPPSIQNKADHTVNWIRRYQDILPKEARTVIEAARFDIQRMKDPTVHNELYQRGPQYDYQNIDAYVFARDNYTCQCCGRKGGKLLNHHIVYRTFDGSNRPENRITVCDECHTPANHAEGGIFWQWMQLGKKLKTYHDATFMNILRKQLYAEFPDATFTYGNITKADRLELGLAKTHANDGVAISMQGQKGMTVVDLTKALYIKQVRKKKRSLHEATPRKGRKEPNRTATRNSKNTKSAGINHLYDRISINGRTGWITGFTGQAAYITDIEGKYVTSAGKTYKQVPLKEIKLTGRCNNWIWQYRDVS